MMKKIIAVLLAALMLLGLAACGGKNQETTENDIIEETVPDTTEEAIPDVTEEALNAVSGHGPDYWCELYGQNRCPFSILCNGTENKYYFKNGGNPTFWIYTSDNTDGWYIYNDYVISGDNKYAIKMSDLVDESFSSFCSYEASPYDGEALTPEQQKEQLNGVFYVLNPYTPVATNRGIKFFTDSSSDSEELPESTVYGLTDTLSDQEWFDIYIDWNPGFYPDFDGDTVDLWAFEHRDKSEYPEQLSAEMKEQAVNLGCIDYEEEADLAHIRTYIPNEEADGLAAGRTDLVLTYGGDVVVGLITVNVTG